MKDLPYTEHRPWGYFVQLSNEDVTKVIHVDPEKRFSLQTHSHRDEHWRVLRGSGIIRVGDVDHDARVGDEFSIPRGTLHRATGGPEGLTFFEEAHGEFDENDIERVEDDFGRA